ncbi:hypothetical protein WR25_05331 [Diploscapter pachys]|uniref:Uncharacterized protein n=1 Tax=Diploscapter pachys TaxID=2018661 RepID=A0A2A2M1Q7_9BILA|nr:hypothetical protein WR25_05331 [Diploscapter pachys]
MAVKKSKIPRPLDKSTHPSLSATTQMDSSIRSPRSPLLSVAHSVRNKFQQLKKLRSRENSRDRDTEAGTSMRGSQSFSGLRQPKTVPKRIDQNANRVIKSSSMDAPKAHSISETFTTSTKETKLVTLPQSNEPLDSRIEEPAEMNANIVMPTVQEESPQINNNGTHKNVKMHDDVITVTEIENSRQESIALPAVSNSPQHIPIEHPVTVRFSETVAAISAISLSTEETASQISRQELDEKQNEEAEGEGQKDEQKVVSEEEERKRMEIMMGKEVIFEPRELKEQGHGHVSRKEQAQMQGRIEQSSKSPQRYVMLVRSTENLHSPNQKAFVIGTKEPGSEEDRTRPEKIKNIRTSKSVEVLKRTKQPDAKSPERQGLIKLAFVNSFCRFILICNVSESLQQQKANTFTIGMKEPMPVSEEDLREAKKIKETKVKKSRSFSNENDFKSPERFILISRSPLSTDAAAGIKRNNTFMIEEKPAGIQEMARVVRSASSGDEMKTIKKSREKKQKTQPEEAASPPRYILSCKTPDAIRRHQTFTIGERSETEPELMTVMRTTISADPIKKKKDKPVRQQSQPEQAVSPERYILLTKTPEAIRRHQTFTIGEKSVEPEIVPTLTTAISAEPIIVKQKTRSKPKRQHSQPEESKPSPRYVMLVKSNEDLRSSNQKLFEIGPKTEPEADRPADEVIETVKVTRSVSCGNEKRKKTKVQEAESKREIAELPPPSRYILMAKTPDAIRRHGTFTIGETDQKTPEVEAAIRTTISAEQIQPKERKIKPVKQRSQPEESASPPRYILTCKTPEALRRHHTFAIGEKSIEEQVQLQMRTTTSAEPIKLKETKTKVIRQRSQPENYKSPERYVLVTRTPQPIRRNNTFYSIGERPKSPDVPWIEEGEITEPIATVGPSAERQRKKEVKEAKERERKAREKSQERYVLTATTPVAMRKFNTFVVETSKGDEEKENRPGIGRGRQMHESVSAEPVADKRKHVSRSESSDSKRHSYLKRLHMEIFGRGRSREKKSDAIRRQQSLDDTAARRIKYSATTPIVDRKYQTFLVENHQDPTEALTQRDDDLSQPVKADRHLLRDLSLSPERSGPSLYVMGSRKPFCFDQEQPLKSSVSPKKNDKAEQLHGSSLRSQSDCAERRNSRVSNATGDMTSPEEEIPMDTHMTPTEETATDLPIVSRPIKDDVIISSPIIEEPGISFVDQGVQEEPIRCIRNEPIFTAPSPPHTSTLPPTVTRSTSPLKSARQIETRLIVDERREAKESKTKGKLFGRKEEKQSNDKEKTDRSIAALSIKSAGKKLTPSFFRRNNRKSTQPKATALQQKGNLQLRMNYPTRKAPLAETEPSVVADSPLVENLPLTFEKWESSPRTRLRHNGFVEPITEITEELQDGNGNVTVIGVTEAGREIRRTGQAARIPHNNTDVAAASELIRILNI